MRHGLRAGGLYIALLLFAGGCLSHGHFDPFHRGDDFDDAHKRFTQFLRWNQFEKASSFVDPEVREEFLVQAAGLTDIRFTDYDVVDVDLDDDFRSATVDVVFRAYRTPSMLEKSFAVRQEWLRDEATDRWRVRPQLAELPRTFFHDAP